MAGSQSRKEKILADFDRVKGKKCKHLDGPTDEDVIIEKPKGCGGCSQSATRVWLCKLHDDCAPYALGVVSDPSVIDCRTCADYEPLHTPV
jgi:hypothetical protein